MIVRPPGSPGTDTLVPLTAPYRSVGLGGDPLPVLGQVGEHRKQHETAHERDGVVEAQRLQPRIARLGPGDAAMAIDARRSDIFGLAEQFLAAIGANDVAERSEEHTSELQSLMRI